MATNPTWRRGCRGGEGIYSQGRSRTVLGPLWLFLNKPKTNSNRSFKTLYNLPRFLLLKKNQTLLFDIEFLKIVLKQAKAFTFFCLSVSLPGLKWSAFTKALFPHPATAVPLDATFGSLPVLFHGGEGWSQDSLKTVESVVLLHRCGKALTAASKEGQRLLTLQAINSWLIQCLSLNIWLFLSIFCKEQIYIIQKQITFL